jgi:hypothetical protein
LKDLQIFPKVDLFTTDNNHLLPRFVTAVESKMAIAVDAFSLNWGNQLVYLHPPIILITRCLRKVIRDRAEE